MKTPTLKKAPAWSSKGLRDPPFQARFQREQGAEDTIVRLQQ